MRVAINVLVQIFCWICDFFDLRYAITVGYPCDATHLDSKTKVCMTLKELDGTGDLLKRLAGDEM